ncbi:MAG: hypothetical protein JSV33_03610 [bacterium]|nr:MAG: hypothetical protein JSV33_03610 [bacterium]
MQRSRISIGAIAAVAVLLVAAMVPRSSSAQISQDTKRRPSEQFASRDCEVKKALSSFIYGIRMKNVGFLMSYYKPVPNNNKNATEKISGLKRELNDFFAGVEAAHSKPLIMMFRPEIEWLGEKAIVTCTIIWNGRMKSDRSMRKQVRERFVVEKIDGRYVITSAVSSPVIFKHIHDAATMNRELANAGIR